MSKSKGRKLAEWLRNLDSNSKASSNTLADDSVTAAKIADDAVTNPKIVDGAIHTANLADANVTFAKLHTDVTITSSTGISGSNDNDTTVPTTAALIDYIGAQIQTKDNSDEITEGSTNLYFTNARVASYLSTNGYGTSSTIIASITDSAPTTLNTLNELAAALGDDANFSTTVTNSIGTKWTQDNTKISNWDTAYGWGNHASAGYLTSYTEADTLNSVTGRGATTTNAVGTGKITVTTSQQNGLELDGSHSNGSYLYINGPGGNTWFGQNGSGLASIWSDGTTQALTLAASTGNATFSGSVTATGASFTGDVSISTTSAIPLVLKDSNATGNSAAIYINYYDQTNAVVGYVGMGSSSNGDNYLYSANGSPHLYSGNSSAPKYNNNTIWHAGNDGSGSGLDADLLDGLSSGSFLRSDANDQMLAQLYGGFGAVTTAGTTDWNHSTNARSGGGYTLLTGSASNGPGGSTYYHPFSFEYSSKNGNGNMTQLAIPYNGSTIWHRYRYSSSWSSWVQEWNSGNDGSGSGLDADTLDGVQGSGYQTRLLQQSSRNIVLRTGATGSAGLFVEGSNDTFRIQIYGTGTDYGFLASEWGGWDIRKTPGGNLTLNNSTANIVYHAGNDGSGSGLDADLWDGNQFSSYLNQALLTTSNPTFNTINYNNSLYAYESSNYIGSDPRWNNSGNNANEGCHHMYATTGSGTQWGQTGLALYNGGAYVFLTTKSGDSNWYHNNNKMWSAGNDGSGSGLDADTLDGVQGSGYQTRLLQQSSRNIVLRTGATGSAGLFVEGSNDTFRIQIYGTGTDYGFLASEWGGWDIRKTPGGNLTLNNSTANIVYHAGNDGSGSGLDADLWDGNQFSSYLNQALLTTSNPTFNDIYSNGVIRGYEGSNYIGFDPRWNASGYNTNEGVFHFYATTASAGTWGQTGLALYNGGAYIFLTTKSGDSNWYHNNNKVWSAGNDGSGSGLDADTLDGYNLSTSGVNVVLRTQANGYILHQNWIQVGNGTGLYCPNGAYFYNDTAYGWYARSSLSTSASVRLQRSNGTLIGWFYGDSSYNQGFLTTAGAWGLKMDNSGNFTASGNVTAYSDIRLKENIKPLEGALAKVLQLRGVQYTRKDTKEKEIGVIAQEIEEILPEVVHISNATAQEKDKEEYTDIRSVDYGRMVSILIEAIKEQQVQIEELKEIIKCQ